MNKPDEFIIDDATGIKVRNDLYEAWCAGYQERVRERQIVDKLQDDLVKQIDAELKELRKQWEVIKNANRG